MLGKMLFFQEYSAKTFVLIFPASYGIRPVLEVSMVVL